MFWLGFSAGLVAGANLGVFLMAMFQIGKDKK